MGKSPTSKYDGLRAMREAQFSARPVRAPVQALRKAVAAVTGKKRKARR